LLLLLLLLLLLTLLQLRLASTCPRPLSATNSLASGV